MSKAPIIIFAYNRKKHLELTIEALKKNLYADESDLIIFSDAAKTPNEQAKVDEVRVYLTQITGFRSKTIHMRSHNYGLAKSIINGVSDILSFHDRVIVMEDDLITSPFFLKYMNEALLKYEFVDRVISVHGYIYPVRKVLPEVFFLRGADCWGWATWRRGWSYFNPDGAFLMNELKRMDLIDSFNFNGAHNFSKMLQDQIDGLNDSWAIRWYASAFLSNKLTLYPGKSLINNIGNDKTGTHCIATNDLDAMVTQQPIIFENINVEESFYAKKVIEDFFNSKKSLVKKLTDFLGINK